MPPAMVQSAVRQLRLDFVISCTVFVIGTFAVRTGSGFLQMPETVCKDAEMTRTASLPEAGIACSISAASDYLYSLFIVPDMPLKAALALEQSCARDHGSCSRLQV